MDEARQIVRNMMTSRHDPKGTTYNITCEAIRYVRASCPPGVTPVYVGVRTGCQCRSFLR